MYREMVICILLALCDLGQVAEGYLLPQFLAEANSHVTPDRPNGNNRLHGLRANPTQIDLLTHTSVALGLPPRVVEYNQPAKRTQLGHVAQTGTD